VKNIGLIGGMSWESSAEYYRLINQAMKARRGEHHNARSIMATVSFEEIKELQHAGKWEELGRRMQVVARQLQAGGADFILLCTNTMHRVAPAIEAVLDVPFIHIVDPTAQALRSAGISRVGLLGTRFTMEDDFFKGRMQSLHGVEVMVPTEAERVAVHDIIYNELCHGIVHDASRSTYQRVIEGLRQSGAQGVILGCTEMALLIKPADSGLPVFDTAELHVQAAVMMADDGA